jgi:ribosomal protein L12E/L44/L45/RPP1/RPP2
MTFHAEVLDGRIITSIIAEQPKISSAAPKMRSNDENDDHEENEHEENEHEEEGEGDDD